MIFQAILKTFTVKMMDQIILTMAALWGRAVLST